MSILIQTHRYLTAVKVQDSLLIPHKHSKRMIYYLSSVLRKRWHNLQLFCIRDLQSDEHSSVILEGFKNKLHTDFANLLSLVSVKMY